MQYRTDFSCFSRRFLFYLHYCKERKVRITFIKLTVMVTFQKVTLGFMQRYRQKSSWKKVSGKKVLIFRTKNVLLLKNLLK